MHHAPNPIKNENRRRRHPPQPQLQSPNKKGTALKHDIKEDNHRKRD